MYVETRLPLYGHRNSCPFCFSTEYSVMRNTLDSGAEGVHTGVPGNIRENWKATFPPALQIYNLYILSFTTLLQFPACHWRSPASESLANLPGVTGGWWVRAESGTPADEVKTLRIFVTNYSLNYYTLVG
jgi:hypothetical protein